MSLLPLPAAEPWNEFHPCKKVQPPQHTLYSAPTDKKIKITNSTLSLQKFTPDEMSILQNTPMLLKEQSEI